MSEEQNQQNGQNEQTNEKAKIIRPFKKRPDESFGMAVFHALEQAHHGDAIYAWTYSQKTMVSKICRKYNIKPTERKQKTGGWLVWLNLDRV